MDEKNNEQKMLGCGKFDKRNPHLMRSCGDILFSNKVWLCEKCHQKSYTKSELEIIARI